MIQDFTTNSLRRYLSEGGGAGFFLIAGPCVVESRELVLEVAERLVSISQELGIPLVFKGSFRKANRSRLDSFTTIGEERALTILAEVREHFGVPVLTDIHESHEAAVVARFVDILQIPAFLSRQTDLLVAAGKTGKMVNIKKGQFLSPQAMRYVAEKVSETGNDAILLTERGTTFGYNDLVVDFRNVLEMKELGYPVVVDASHSLQRPNTQNGVTGGDPQYIEAMALAAIATGADGLFIETHPSPASALSDAESMLPLSQMEPLLRKAVCVRAALREV
ncbi:MAG: 3-deoxy-8-phosphooctulonate synthase [Porphyromonas sp.]|nr:3-deoxy-8-phosphooctulonate synthase [Porphyromonas sp.]